MYYEIIYNGVYDYQGEDITLDNYEFYIRDNKEDVIAFMFEQHFDHYYPGYCVGSTEFDYVKEIENKWLFRELDFSDLYYENYAFKDWLKDRHVDDAIEQYLSEIDLEDLYDYDDEEEEEDEWD